MAWTVGRRVSVKANLRDKVLRPFGVDQDQDAELQAIALDLLDDVVKDMNSHLYEFNKITHADISLVDGTADYTLVDTTTDAIDTSTIIPYKESYAYVRNSTDSQRYPLTYLPWVKFMERLKNPLYSNTGIPELYTFRNLDQDGVVSLYPTPSDSTQVLELEYYRRIPLVSDATATVNIPEELETPLIYGACKRMAIHLLGAEHASVMAYDALEQRALAQVKASDKRHPDQQQRFVVSDFRNRNRAAGRRSLYIKV